jgi:hypothetical protein
MNEICKDHVDPGLGSRPDQINHIWGCVATRFGTCWASVSYLVRVIGKSGELGTVRFSNVAPRISSLLPPPPPDYDTFHALPER